MAYFSGTFYSESLAKHVPFTAIIPTQNESLHSDSTNRSPEFEPKRTLYLLHGWNGTHSSWLLSTRIYELARDNDLAIIMPSGENSFYFDQYQGQMYGQFIGKELVSITREMFNLSSRKEDTWIGGLSMGGYGALRNGLEYDQTFGKIAAFSSRILTRRGIKENEKMNDDMIHLHLKNITGIDSLSDLKDSLDLYELIKTRKNPQEMYISCGLEDYLLEENRQFHAYLENNRIPHIYDETPGGHDWDFWNEQIEKAVKWLVK